MSMHNTGTTSNRTPRTSSNHIRKTLFLTPIIENARLSRSNSSASSKILDIMSRLQLERNTETFVQDSVREGHEERMKHLKDLVKVLEEDEWKYTSTSSGSGQFGIK